MIFISVGPYRIVITFRPGEKSCQIAAIDRPYKFKKKPKKLSILRNVVKQKIEIFFLLRMLLHAPRSMPRHMNRLYCGVLYETGYSD
jgi:hypothetical protein